MGGIFFIAGIFIATQLLSYYGEKTKAHRAYTNGCPPPDILEGDIFFKGNQSGINIEQTHQILLKRFVYYQSLNSKLQNVFLKRVHAFMRKKYFIIKDDEVVREMPVLASAAAVQLTFGLKKYLLPFYKYIKIYPEEYIADYSLKVLAGRVEGNMITVAWNHLLKGYSDPVDGANVGLHEMSHALYIQKIVVEENYSKKFSSQYSYLLSECQKAYNLEVEGHIDVYSKYANTNLQEFWAESAELFFEKPNSLKTHYPRVYEGMKLLLNQDPLNKEHPLLQNNMPFHKRVEKLIFVFKNGL